MCLVSFRFTFNEPLFYFSVYFDTVRYCDLNFMKPLLRINRKNCNITVLVIVATGCCWYTTCVCICMEYVRANDVGRYETMSIPRTC
jgi:hypothetical protein